FILLGWPSGDRRKEKGVHLSCRISRGAFSHPNAATIHRAASGTPRSSDPQDAGARADAWLGHRTADRTGLTRATPGWARIAVSRSAPARSEALDSIGMGPLREQPPGPVLLADPAWP